MNNINVFEQSVELKLLKEQNELLKSENDLIKQKILNIENRIRWKWYPLNINLYQQYPPSNIHHHIPLSFPIEQQGENLPVEFLIVINSDIVAHIIKNNWAIINYGTLNYGTTYMQVMHIQINPDNNLMVLYTWYTSDAYQNNILSGFYYR